MSVGFNILGNVKLKFLPFTIKPEQQPSNILVFSFKKIDSSKNPSMLLHIVPDSYKKVFNEDIASKLVLMMDVNHNNVKQKIDFDGVLNLIPTIEIREFLPDTKLEQFLDFFSKIVSKLMDLFKSFKNSRKEKKEKGSKKLKALKDDNLDAGMLQSIILVGSKAYNTVAEVIKKTFTFLVGSDSNLPSLFWTSDGLGGFTSRFNIDLNLLDLYNNGLGSVSGIEKILVHDFPRLIYYKLLSVTNTNVYILPNTLSEKLMYSSSGNVGWDTADSSIAITKSINNIPVIGLLLGTLVKPLLSKFDNLRISYMPYWKSEKGNDPHPVVKIEFELINDNLNNSIENFIFVNTIVPNNKILQYGMFLHSPCLYDVKIGGYDRLFACSGKFEIKHKGMLRVPPTSFLKNIEKHISNSVDKNKLINAIIKHDLIRIPDTYEVTMEFTSLLPASFNNYIYTYSTNESMLETIDSMPRHSGNPAYDILARATGDLAGVLGIKSSPATEDSKTEEKKLELLPVAEELLAAGEVVKAFTTQTDITKAGE